MTRNKLGSLVFLFLSICLATPGAGAGSLPAFPESTGGQVKSSGVEFISAEELKAKTARNEPVTIIDVRATNAYVDSDTKIKGAIHLKLRKLKSRLAFPPLKNVSRTSEVVTYCACPSDETSLRAAQVLMDAGFTRVRALKGGWEAWRKVSGPVEARPRAL